MFGVQILLIKNGVSFKKLYFLCLDLDNVLLDNCALSLNTNEVINHLVVVRHVLLHCLCRLFVALNCCESSRNVHVGMREVFGELVEIAQVHLRVVNVNIGAKKLEMHVQIVPRPHVLLESELECLHLY
jgi:hypothetical protein